MSDPFYQSCCVAAARLAVASVSSSSVLVGSLRADASLKRVDLVGSQRLDGCMGTSRRAFAP